VRAGNHLAVVCLSFGVAFAAFVSGSLEQRIGNLVFFSLIPAMAFYAAGHTLGQVLVFGVALCDMIMARCFRYAMRLANDLFTRAGAHVSNWLARSPALRQKVCYLAHQCYGRVHHVIFDFSCLLIRSAARFVIRMEASADRHLATYSKSSALRH
jgi:hypothetical protein